MSGGVARYRYRPSRKRSSGGKAFNRGNSARAAGNPVSRLKAPSSTNGCSQMPRAETQLIAALPMYDWPEVSGEVDALWARLRDAFRVVGIGAPERLVRTRADIPWPLQGDFDPSALWRHPALLLSQTCWGPLHATDLADHVTVLGQPDYSGVVGGHGTKYSSAIVIAAVAARASEDVAPPEDGRALLPLNLIRGKCFIGSEPHSLSGYLGLEADLAAAGTGYDHFSQTRFSGGHRLSIRAIAAGEADVATIDCRSWQLARQYEPAAAALRVVGWTEARPGLPYIMARGLADRFGETVRAALCATGLIERQEPAG